MRSTITLLASIFGATCFAQPATNTSDSTLKLVKEIHEQVASRPLDNKKIGFDINPFRLLYLDKVKSLSGGFELYNITPNAVLHFPLLWALSSDYIETSLFEADAHYRYFPNGRMTGFFISPFVRYSRITGYSMKVLDNQVEDNSSLADSKVNNNRFGLGFGLGYMSYSRSGFYWGASLGFGRFLVGQETDDWTLSDNLIIAASGTSFIWDMELLKFGWTF